MKHQIVIGIVIVALLCASGCTVSPSSQDGESGAPRTAATTAAPGFGSIEVISDPWGANVYLDGAYQGTAPRTIQNVSAGKHALTVSMTGYKVSNTTVTVKANEITSVKKSLSVGKPSIYMVINSTKYIYQGSDPLLEIVGKLYNTGERPAYNMVLIVEMTPKDSADKEYRATREIWIGQFNPGDERNIVEHIQLRRDVDYKGAIKYRYEDDNDKKVTGTAKTF